MPDLSGSMGPDAAPDSQRDTLLGRLLRAQGVLPGGLSNPADPDRAQARALADAMTGADAPPPQPQPRDTLLTRLLTAQGLMHPGALGQAAQAQQGQPASPPVTVNVTPPAAPQSSVAPPVAGAMGNTPAPIPPVSDELVGSPAFAASGPPTAAAPAAPQGHPPNAFLTRLLSAQGLLPPRGPINGPPQAGPQGPDPSDGEYSRAPEGEDPDVRIAREEATRRQSEADNDRSKWSPPAVVPEGLRPVVSDGRLVPGEYTDITGTTVYRTGDPARDERLGNEDARGRDAAAARSDHEMDRGYALGPEDRVSLGFTGETPEQTERAIEVTSNRPDPYLIDARARRYVAEALSALDGNPVGFDPQTGEPVPLNEDDVAYRQSTMLDGAYRDRVESLARQRALEEARQEQRLPLQEAYASGSQETAQARIDSLQRYVRMRRGFWDQARAAQAAASARYPNPDDLLGGKGSWSRAVALGIASAGGGVGMGGAAALINNEMNLQWAGRTGAYNRERQRMADAAMNGAEATEEMNVGDAALVGQQAAAKQRLADQFDLLAARTADRETQARYLELSGKLREESAKDLGTFATQLANRDLKEAQLAQKGWHYDTKLHRWVSMDGTSIGVGMGGTGSPGTAVQSPTNPFGKLGVREPDRDGRMGGWWQASDEDSAKKAREAGIEYGKLDDALNEMQAIAREAQGAKSAGGQVWRKWQDERDAKYRLAFVNATQIAARVLHGRPPGRFTMEEVQHEYPELAKAWEANNVEPLIRWIRDGEDRNYNKSMHQYGYNGTYRSDRPAPNDEPNANTLKASVVGDYVPGHVPDIENAVGLNRGDSLEDRGALGAYVKAYYGLNNATDNGLIESLGGLKQRATGNRLKAIQRRDTRAAGAWGIIIDALDAQAREVASGQARKRIEAQQQRERQEQGPQVRDWAPRLR